MVVGLTMMIDCIFIPVVLITLYPFCFSILAWVGGAQLSSLNLLYLGASQSVAGGRIQYISGVQEEGLYLT